MYKSARKLLSGKCEALHLQIEEAYSQHFSSKDLLGHWHIFGPVNNSRNNSYYMSDADKKLTPQNLEGFFRI